MSLIEEFKDPEYRHSYADSFANTIIATQLRLLRGKRTQAEFAELIGMKQSRVSEMEDENYAAWSTRILKEIAAKNDVAFLGRFVSFGELLQWSARLSEDVLRVPSYEGDPLAKEEARTNRQLYWVATTNGPSPVIVPGRPQPLKVTRSQATDAATFSSSQTADDAFGGYRVR